MIEVLKQALEALIWTTGSGDFGEGGYAHEGAKKCLFPAIAAIKEAIAELESQEPVGVIYKSRSAVGGVIHDENKVNDGDLVYTRPPQRTCVGLTDEEMQAIVDAQPLVSNINIYFKAIEAKLKEKNT